MNLKRFITTELPIISSKEELEAYRSVFTSGGSLMVICPDAGALGIATPLDYLESPSSRAGTIDFRRFSISSGTKIREALMLMSKLNMNILSVFDGDHFQGIISSHDLVNYLLDENSGYRLLLKNAVRNLRKPIANLLGIMSLLQKDVTPVEREEVVLLSNKSCKEAFTVLRELESLNKPDPDLSKVNSTLDELYNQR